MSWSRTKMFKKMNFRIWSPFSVTTQSPRHLLFWFVFRMCLFIWDFTHMETSPLPVKGFKFWHILGTCGHWAVRVFKRATPTVTRASFNNCQGPVTLTPSAESLAVLLWLPVFTTWVCRGWNSNVQPSACEANALPGCATATVLIW